MRQKNAKLSRKIGQKEFDNRARSALLEYMDRLAGSRFSVRVKFVWQVLRGRNPHTGRKPNE